jgi:hypothetical protein
VSTRHPDTLEPSGQWVKQGPCGDEPDAMFPGTVPAEIEYAKAICQSCPVIQACGEWALETREPDGVWGGMSEKERSNLLRQAARRNLTPQAIAARAEQRRPRTLQSIFNACTSDLDGGHLVWDGPRKVHFGGMIYTPKQVCFTADRGHRPDGQLRSDCGITECVLPRHLVDTGERSQRAASVKAHA